MSGDARLPIGLSLFVEPDAPNPAGWSAVETVYFGAWRLTLPTPDMRALGEAITRLFDSRWERAEGGVW